MCSFKKVRIGQFINKLEPPLCMLEMPEHQPRAWRRELAFLWHPPTPLLAPLLPGRTQAAGWAVPSWPLGWIPFLLSDPLKWEQDLAFLQSVSQFGLCRLPHCTETCPGPNVLSPNSLGTVNCFYWVGQGGQTHGPSWSGTGKGLSEQPYVTSLQRRFHLASKQDIHGEVREWLVMGRTGSRAKSRVTWDREAGSRWPPYPLSQISICQLVWLTVRVPDGRDLGDATRAAAGGYLFRLQGMLVKVAILCMA